MMPDQSGLEKDDVFPTLDHTLRHIWGRLVKHAGVDDLRYHDFRHEAVSPFFKRVKMCLKSLSSVRIRITECCHPILI